MTCGNVLGGQPLRKAIAGHGRLSRTGQLGRRQEPYLVDFKDRNAGIRSDSPGRDHEPGPESPPARTPASEVDQAGRSLAYRGLRRQADDLRTTAPTASRCRTDSLGALETRAPSLASSQGSTSRWVLLILERLLHSCDELHVARRDVPISHHEERRKRQDPEAGVRARGVRPLQPPHGASRTAPHARIDRPPARPPAGAAPAAGAAAAPRLR